MKRISLYFLTLFFVLSYSVQAQISSDRKTMSEGVYEALVIEIPGLNKKTTSKLWTDFTKDFYSSRSKYNRKTKEYFTDDVDIAGIGKGNTIDIYTSIAEKSGGSELSMWIDLGGSFLSRSEHGDRYVEAEKMLIRFGLEGAKEKIRLDIEDQEKTLKGLGRDLEKLATAKERYESDIEKAKQMITEAEQGIIDNTTLQEAKNKEITAQEDLIETTKKKLNDL